MATNTFYLSGRCTKDPVIAQGKKYLVLGIACGRYNKETRQQEPEFFNVMVHGRTAEIEQEFIRKGDRVWVSGRISAFFREGSKLAEYILNCNSLEFSSKAKPQSEEDESAEREVQERFP